MENTDSHSLFATPRSPGSYMLANTSQRSLIGTISRAKVKDPLSFISRAHRRNAASATRDIAPPTLMRLTPAAVNCATVSVGSARPITRLNGLRRADTTVWIVARSRMAGAQDVGACRLELL